MDLPDSAWMMGMNMNSSYAPPPQQLSAPGPGFSAACSELFARRPDIFDVPPSGAAIPMMQSAPPPDMDAFRNNFMYFQPQPEPPGMNAWMCGGGVGGGVGGGGSMMASGLMGSGGGMAALMLPDDENENMYFAQSASGGVGGGGGIGGDLGAGDMTMGMGGGCQAGWTMARPPAGPSDWSSGGGGINGGSGGGFGFLGGIPESNGGYHPAAMAGLGPLMGHRNLLPDI